MPHIARVMNRNVETNLAFDEALAWPPSDKSRTRPDDRLPAQGTPKTLPNGEEVLVPDQEANEAILAQFRY